MRTKYTINILGMIILSTFFVSCAQKQEQRNESKQQNSDNAGDKITIPSHEITVDGEIADWEATPAITVEDKAHLWIGDGLPEGAWQGKQDLSYTWKTAWNDGRLYFLFDVKDDTLSNFDQQYAWLNDCIEIYVDPHNLGGSRITGIGAENTFEDRIGKKMRGYEMQFLPSQPPKVFVDDSRGVYYTDAEQNEFFKEEWNGEVVTKKTADGYLMEVAFTVPGTNFKSGEEIGMDIGICDDDGDGRKSLLLWSGYKGAFWLTMDNFNKMFLE